MIDYCKLWIYDKLTIKRVLNDKKIKQQSFCDEQGNLLWIEGRYSCWKFVFLAKFNRLEITGSLHKYWNGGTNENDFSVQQVIEAVKRFCKVFHVKPALAKVINLEFGLNLQLTISGSAFIENVICFNGGLPIHPYDHKPHYFFIEFAHCEYYFKLYDKAKQYRKQIPSIPEILRIEVKGMTRRYLGRSGIETLDDLLCNHKLQALASELQRILNGLVMDDSTIDVAALPPKSRMIYENLRNPRNWVRRQGSKSSTTRHQEKQFQRIVEKYGHRKIISTLIKAVKNKIEQLST